MVREATLFIAISFFVGIPGEIAITGMNYPTASSGVSATLVDV